MNNNNNHSRHPITPYQASQCIQTHIQQEIETVCAQQFSEKQKQQCIRALTRVCQTHVHIPAQEKQFRAALKHFVSK